MAISMAHNPAITYGAVPVPPTVGNDAVGVSVTVMANEVCDESVGIVTATVCEGVVS